MFNMEVEPLFFGWILYTYIKTKGSALLICLMQEKLSLRIELYFGRNIMSTSAIKNLNFDFAATKVWFTNESLCVQLTDGREIFVPIEYYPRLRDATKVQRENFELLGEGTSIHWPEIDEDLSIEGIVLGIQSR